MSRPWTSQPTPLTMPSCVTDMKPSSRNCALRKMTWRPSSMTLTLSAMNGTTPCGKSNVQLLRSGRLKPLGWVASSGPWLPSCLLQPSSEASKPRRLRSSMPCAMRYPPHLSCHHPAPRSSWPSCRSSLRPPLSPHPKRLTFDALASVLRHAAASSAAPTDAPNISIAGGSWRAPHGGGTTGGERCGRLHPRTPVGW